MTEEQWISNTALQLYTDSSDTAIGCVFDKFWFFEKFNETCQDYSINCRELFAIVKAVATFGSELSDKNDIF